MGDEYRTNIRAISGDYLRAIGVRLLEGRWLSDHDTASQPRVMLVNRAWGERFSPAKSPVGTTAVFVTTGRVRRPIAWEIVGVVENVRTRMDGGLASNQPPTELPLLGYVDLRQFLTEFAGDGAIDRQSMELDMLMGEPGGFSFGVEPTLTLDELRRVAREVDPRIAVEGVTRMGDVFSGLIGRQRFYAVVLTLFGGVAGFIAAIGIYGVLAYAITQRTPEFGIRLALGAKPRDVLGMVLRQGLVLVLLGTAAGLAGALAVTRYLSSMLFGLTAVDPLTYASVAVMFAAVAMAASYIPARRATKVDALIALRYE